MVCDLEPSNYLEMNMNSPGIRTTIQNNTWVRIFPCHQKSIQHSHKPCGCTTIWALAYMCSYANERVNESVCLCWYTPNTLSSSIDASGIIETTIVNIFNNQKRGHSGAHTVLHTEYTKNYYAQFAACERIKCVCVSPYIFWMNRKHVSDEPLIYSIYLFRTFPAIGALLRFYCFYFRDVLSAVLCLYGKVTMKSHMYQSSPLHSIKMIHGVELMPRLALTHDFSPCTSSYIVWRNTTLEFRSYKSKNYWNSKRDIH